MKSLAFVGAALALAANQAAGQYIALPSTPVGGLLHAQFTLTTSGGSPIAGLPVNLSVPNGCGTLQDTSITTDSQGNGRFDFVAGSLPGFCLIRGESGGTSLQGYTSIYRPSEMRLRLVYGDTFLQIPADSPGTFNLRLEAGNTGLLGFPLTIDPPPATGPSATVLSVVARQPDAGFDDGMTRIDIRTNSVPGLFDLWARQGGLAKRVRVRNGPLPGLSAARSVRVNSPRGDILVSLLDGPATCLVRASYVPDVSTLESIPPGISNYPLGRLNIVLPGCTGAVNLRLEYPQPIPAESRVWRMVNNVGPVFDSYPAAISGNSLGFLVIVPGNVSAYSATIGVAPPALRPAPGDVPAIQDMWWAGASENGWGLSLAQRNGGLSEVFGVIYAYDADGKATWWVLPATDWNARGVLRLSGPAYTPYGTPYHQYDAGVLVAGEPEGTVELEFADADHATLRYGIAGASGIKSIGRQLFGPPGTSPAGAVGGMWWGGPEQNGWGISMMQQGAALFSVWFTYDDSNRPTWYVMPAGTWSGTSYSGRIYRTRGSPWLGRPYDAAQLQISDVGSFRTTFNGTTAQFEYSMEGHSGTLALRRQAPF